MSTIETLFETAAGDRRRGASEIERRLVSGLLSDRGDWTAEALQRGAARLLAAQPAMANLRNLARRLGGDDLAVIERRLADRSSVLADLDGRLAVAAGPWIDPARRVLTLSRSSAVAAALIGAARAGWRGEVVVFDGSPHGGGAGQADRLAGVLGGVRSQPDAMMPHWIDGGGVRVVVGADAVGDRRFVNVCGTRTLVELAAARQAPVIVVADTGKDLADAELDELLAGTPAVGDGPAGRRWPLFEATPLALVTARVAE
jgi:translation initiation factor 2B subunit (eIF-2B alpha/beta/delta family)